MLKRFSATFLPNPAPDASRRFRGRDRTTTLHTRPMNPLYFLLSLVLAVPVASAQIALPVTFEDTSIDYELVDFEGNGASQIVADPTDATNRVVKSTRPAGAGGAAGTTVANASGFAQPIPFAQGMTTMSVRVWTPAAGTPVRLKVEKVGDPTISVEAQLNSTKAMEWETLVFDFANELEGTAAINFNSEYTKASIFFDFGLEGATAETVYYWDDLAFGGEASGGGGSASAIVLPVTFEDESVNYELRDFGGAKDSEIVADPDDASNKAVRTVRGAGAESFAGTVVADESGFAQPIPFAQGMTTMSVRVRTPVAGTPVRLKVENNDGNVSVEAQVNSTKAMEWETLVFDFATPVAGAPINFSAQYAQAVIFFDFGKTAATEDAEYFWDDLAFDGEASGGGGGTTSVIALPVTFEDTGIDYELTDFGGNESTLVPDPTDASNTVVQSIRKGDALAFAGTTVADSTGFTQPIPFAEGMTTMSLRVWTPAAGTPVRLKVEKVGDPTISVEAQLNSTKAMEWETLVFDFANELEGTAAINFNAEYTKASVFFNFGEENSGVATTYYWDYLAFGRISVDQEGSPLPEGMSLSQNAPNPFRGTTEIRFSLATAEHVSVQVYNVLGQHVATLADRVYPQGDHALTLDASGLASGTYLYRLLTDSGVATRSMQVQR